MMGNTFYITTPIYYVNARPHLGHAYTTIVADVAARCHAMMGYDTFFLTGTDEHGDKIAQAAQKEQVSPRVYADKISRLFQQLWPELAITNNKFIRTTDPSHIDVVSRILQQIYDAGDIYFDEYEGLYCYGCERFYTERELVDGKCPDHETEPSTIRESNYFFRMSRYQQWLIDHIHRQPDFIRPERYRNEVLSFLKEPLEDLCISRPKSRLQWGITLPFDENFVTYVWFDALINYISALGYPDGELYRRYWPVAQHIVAKDILKPHGIYWPIMLKAAGIPIYRHLNVHGYWNVDRSKMSKSLGNVIEPLDLKGVYGLDAFRYFLMRDMVFGLDSNFSEDALVQRVNSDLANDLGNLYSRVVAMTHKYFSGSVPSPEPEVTAEMALGLESGAHSAVAAFEEAVHGFAFHKALAAVWEFINLMNRTIDATAPWNLVKRSETRKELEAVIYELLEGLRVVAGLIQPVMPLTAAKMQAGLGLDPTPSGCTIEHLKQWGVLEPGSSVSKTEALFPRIETKPGRDDAVKAGSPEPAPPLPIKKEITIDELSRVDLRVATVVHAEAVPKAKKLLRIEVDMGEKRTVVAGISETYAPDELIGKQVIVVANLKPAKLMGIESRGMLLAAVDSTGPTLTTVDRSVPPGTPLR